MIYDHNVICGGIFYRAGQEVPAPTTSTKTVQESATSDEASNKSYTKSEIQQMNVKSLRELATSEGIENADELSGTKLKELLIEKLGL